MIAFGADAGETLWVFHNAVTVTASADLTAEQITVRVGQTTVISLNGLGRFWRRGAVSPSSANSWRGFPIGVASSVLGGAAGAAAQRDDVRATEPLTTLWPTGLCDEGDDVTAMPLERRFRQVDAFGEDPGTGNPVAVILDAEGLDDETMRRFSVWSNLSECTFVLPPNEPGAAYRVRIFSLNTELPFAGHPTLGTAQAWLHAGGVPATPGIVIQECGAGLVPVRVEADRIAFTAPPRLRSGPVDPGLLAVVIEILGVERERVLDAEWLDNGPGWVGVLLDHADTVLKLHPDAAAYPGRWDIGVIGACDVGSETAFELRAFFTEGDGPLLEDPVTGSLNAAAAEWLIATRRASAPYVAAHVTALGRRGRIHVSVEDHAVWVGGRAEVVLSGVALL